MKRYIIQWFLIVALIIIFGCAASQKTAHDASSVKVNTSAARLQNILSGIFPVYPGAVVVSSDECPRGSQFCSAELEVDAPKSDILNFYKIMGRKKGWIFDKEARAKTETSSLASPEIWGLMNFTSKFGDFKSLTLLIPSDKHTGTTKTRLSITMMNPPDTFSFGAPAVTSTEKIDIGKSAANDEWKIKVEYVIYEGTRIEIKDDNWMKPAVFGDAAAGFQLVRVRAHLKRLDGNPIMDEFLKIAVAVRASDGKTYGLIGSRTTNGEFYNHGRGGSQRILVPVTEKSEIDYVFAIPVAAKAEAFIWPNMRPMNLIAGKSTPTVSPEAQKIADRAEEFLGKRMYQDAIREAEKALSIDPNNAKALETRAESYRMTGKYDEAIRDADRLLRIQPDNAYTLRTRASAFWKKNQFGEAILDATRALKIEPKNLFALEYRADSYRRKSLYDEAIRDAGAALTIDPKNAFVLSTRADAYRMKSEYDLAIRDAGAALTIDPKNAFVLSTRADAYRMKGEYDLAIRDAIKSLEIEPDNDFAKNTLAEAEKSKVTK